VKLPVLCAPGTVVCLLCKAPLTVTVPLPGTPGTSTFCFTCCLPATAKVIAAGPGLLSGMLRTDPDTLNVALPGCAVVVRCCSDPETETVVMPGVATFPGGTGVKFALLP